MGMKMASDPVTAYQYGPILRDIEQVMEYFGRMASLLAHIDDEAVMLSRELGSLLEDDTANIHRTTDSVFAL